MISLTTVTCIMPRSARAGPRVTATTALVGGVGAVQYPDRALFADLGVHG
jgi:hypothetical protein